MKFPSRILALLLAASVLSAQTVVVPYSNGDALSVNRSTSVAAPLELTIAAGSASESGVISGDGSVTKTGAGLLTLHGANTYTGGTTISDGWLQLGADNRLAATGALTINGGAFDQAYFAQTASSLSGTGGRLGYGTLTLNQTTATTFSGHLYLASIVFNGAGGGALTLAGSDDNFFGILTVNGGTVTLAKDSAAVHALGNNGLALTINSGGTVALGGAGHDQIYNNSDVILNTGGTFDLKGYNEGFNNLTGAGTVTNSTASTTSTLTLGENNGTATFAGSIQNGAGTTALVKTGTGTLTLSGANTFTGGIALDAGALTLRSALAQRTGTGIQGLNSVTLRIQGTPDGGTGAVVGAAGSNGAVSNTPSQGGNGTAGSLPISLGDSSTLINSGTVTGGAGGRGGNHLFNGGSANGGTPGAGAGGLVLGNSATLANTGTITGGAGGIGGNGQSGLASGGFGTARAGGAGGSAATLGNSATVTNSLTLRGGDGGKGGDAAANAGGISTAGAGGTGGAALLVGSNSTVTNSLTLTGGNGGTAGTAIGAATKIGANGGAGGTGVTLGSNSTFTNTSGGVITGGNGGNRTTSTGATGGVIGAGGAAIAGANLTIINSGTLTGGLNGDATRGNAVNFTSGTNTLELHAGSAITGNVVAGGTSDTLTLGGSNAATFDISQLNDTAQFRGFEAFTKTGTGTWTLTGTGTFTGNTTISAGTLQIGNGGTSGSLAGAITNAGTLAFNRSDAFEYSGILSGSGALTQDGAGTLTLAGNNATFTGNTTLAAGTLSLNSANALGAPSTGTISFTGGTLQFSANNFADYSSRFSTAANQLYRLDTNGQIVTLATALTSSAGALTKSGAGTLILSGTNTYSGGTTVAEGTLQLGTGINGGTTGSLGGNVSLDTVTSTLAFNRSNDLTYNNVISGLGAVTKSGTGTLTLTGTNTYIGTTTVTAGTLQLGNSGTVLNDDGSVVVNATGTLQLGTADETIGSLAGNGAVQLYNNGGRTLTVGGNNASTSFDGSIQATGGGGALTKTGTGTLTLTGTNTYTGITTLSAGALQIGDGGTSGSITGNIATSTNTILGFNRSNDLTYSAVISGAGRVVKAGTGTLTLSNAQTFSGGIQLDTGSLVIANTLFQRTGIGIQGANNVTLRILGAADGGNGAVVGAAGLFGANLSAGSQPVALGDSALLYNSGTITGGHGNQGNSVSNSAATATAPAGSASAGALTMGQSATLDNRGTVMGGNGGNGSNASTDLRSTGGPAIATAGAGAAGGIAAELGQNATVTNSQTLRGGNGGNGGAAMLHFSNRGTAVAGHGGAGGAGLVVGHSSTVTNTLAITGGNGGYAGEATASAGTSIVKTGGAGGTGVTLGNDSTLTNSGTITGGNGGSRSFGYPGSINGAGGAAIAGNNLTLTNSGTLIGGLNGDGVTRDNAITLGGTTNTVELQAGSAITGNVVANGTTDTLRLGGASNATFDISGLSATGQFRGFEAFTKTGTGTWILTGAGTYTGTTTISNGTLQIGNGATAGSFAGAITNNAQLTFNGNNASTYSGILSGAGALTKQGSGTLTLSGNNATFTGNTTLEAGTLALGSANALGAPSTGTISFTGGTLQFSAANTTDYSSRFSTAASQAYKLDTNGQTVALATALTSTGGSLTKSGTGTLVLSGANTYSGGTTVSDGTLQLGTGVNGGTTGSLVGNVSLSTATSALVFNRSNSLAYSDVISGSGTLTKSGSGNLTLTGANTYSGGTTVNAGTLTGTTTSLQGDIANHAALTFDQTTTGTYAGVISGSGALTKSGSGTVTFSGTNTAGSATVSAGTLVLTGANTYSGSTSVAAGASLHIGNNGTTGSLAGNVSLAMGTSALTFNRSDALTYNDIISGLGTVTKSGNGTLTLGGANTYSGGTTISDGTLELGHSLALQNSTLNYTTGTLSFGSLTTATLGGLSGSQALVLTNSTPVGVAFTVGGNNASTSYSGALSGLGSFTKTGTGTLFLTGTNTYTGGTTITAGTLQLGNTGNTGSVAGDITNHATLRFSRSDAFNYDGIISGTGQVIQSGTGTLTLSGANTFSGITSMANGSALTLGHSLALQNSTLFYSTGTLSFGSLTTATFGGLGGSKALSLDNADTTAKAVALTVGGNNEGNTYSGVLSGLGSLTKTGTGDLSLTGANTFAGGLTVASGTLILTGANTYTGGTTISGGTLQIGNGIGGTTGSLTGNVSTGDATNHGTLAFARAGSYTFSGNITGAGGISVANSVTLGGVNTYTGPTAIANFSSLTLGSASALPTSTAVTLGTSSTLFLGGNAVTLSSLANSSGTDASIAFGTNGSLTLTNATDGSFTGSFSASAGSTFTKSGVGNFTVNQSNFGFDGAIAVNQGTLTWHNGGIGSASIASGATLALGGFSPGDLAKFSGSGNLAAGSVALTYGAASGTYTVGLNLSGSSGLGKSGGSTLVLSGNNSSSSGAVSITGGTLRLGSVSALGNVALNLGSGTVFDLNNFSAAVSSLTGSGEVKLGTGTFTVTHDSGTPTYFGAITGSGGFTKDGTGLMQIGTNSTYTGLTTVSAGTLNYARSGGNILNNGTVRLTTNSGAYDGNLSGSGVMEIAQGGTLALTGSLTHLGGTTVSSAFSRLSVGNGGTTGSLAGNVALSTATSELWFNRSDAVAFAGNITGAGNVTKLGANTLTLSGTNSFNGLTINDGTVSVASDASLGSGGITFNGHGTLATTADFTTSRAATLSIGANRSATFDTAADTTLTWNGNLNLALLTKAGAGTLALSNDTINEFTLSAGTAALGAGNTISRITVDNGATLSLGATNQSLGFLNLISGQVTGTGTLSTSSFGMEAGTLSANLTNSNAIAKSGTDTFTLGGTLSTPALSVGAGTVNLTSTGLLNSPYLTVNGTGTFNMATGARLGGASTQVTVSGNGTFDFGANDLTLGSLSVAGGSLLGTGTLTSEVYYFGSEDSTPITVSASLAGATANVWISDGNHLILAGNNTYGGTTYVGYYSTLQLGNGGTTGSVAGRIRLQPEAGLRFNRSNDFTLSLANVNVLGNAVTFTQLGTGKVTLQDAHPNYPFPWAGSLTTTFRIEAGTLALANTPTYVYEPLTYRLELAGGTLDLGGQNLTMVNTSYSSNDYAGSIVNGTLTFADAATVYFTSGGAGTTVSANLIGDMSLVKTGSGTLTLSGDNTYGGSTTINSGTLQLGNSGTVLRDDNSVIITTGTLALGAANETIGSLSGSTGSVVELFNGSGRTLTVGGNNGNSAYAGVIRGAGGALTKVGGGTLTLTGANTYSGGTTLNEGTLSVAADSGLGATSGPLTFNGGTLATTANFTSTRNTLLNAGGGTFNVANGTNLNWNGDISGNGSLTKLGLGTLLLGGTNTYSGATFVNAGTLRLTSANAFSANTTLHVAGGATFDNNGFEQTFADLSGPGNVTLSGGLLTVGPNGSHTSTYSGVLSGTGTLSKAGTGTLILDNANTFTGTTTVRNGTLQLGNSLALQTSTLDYNNQGGTLSFGSLTAASLGALTGSQSLALTNNASNAVTLSVGGSNTDSTFAGAITGAGSLNKIGTGTLTLTGNNTSAGPTTISGGTLQISNGGSWSGNFINNANLIFNRSDYAYYSGVISGSGSLTKDNSGALFLDTAQTYTGGTFINAGDLVLTGDNRLVTTSALTLTGGALQLNDHAQTVASLSGTGGTVAHGTLTTTQSGNSTFAGSLFFTQLIHDGIGTLTLAGNSDNGWGSALVKSGTLVFAKDSSDGVHAVGGDFGATVLTVNAGGTVRIAGTGGQQIFFATNVVLDAAVPSSPGVTAKPAGTLDLNGRNESFAGLSGGGTVTNSAAATTSTLVLGRNDASGTFAGKFQDGAGILALTKVESGTLTLTGTSTHTGDTNIYQGTLVVNGSLAHSAVTVHSGGRLSGSGAIGALTLAAGSTLAVGNSPGTLTAASATWTGGANYEWEIVDASSPLTGAGTRYDLLSISGALNITATSDTRFTITLLSLLANNSSGDALNFNSAVNSSYTIASAGSIFGFDANKFTIDSSDFTNSLTGGSWNLSQVGNTIRLNFTAAAAAIPEPSTYAALAGVLALALAARRKHRTGSFSSPPRRP